MAENKCRELGSLILPYLATVAIVILLVRSLALVPSVGQSLSAQFSAERRFDSRSLSVSTIEEAEAILATDVWLPVYFPDFLLWPPTSVAIQRYPEKGVTLTFRFSDQREALTVKQFLTIGVHRAGIIPQPLTVSRRATMKFEDQESVLVEGFDAEGNPRNVVYWEAHGRFIMMAGAIPAIELARMARSLRSVKHTPVQGIP